MLREDGDFSIALCNLLNTSPFPWEATAISTVLSERE